MVAIRINTAAAYARGKDMGKEIDYFYCPPPEMTAAIPSEIMEFCYKECVFQAYVKARGFCIYLNDQLGAGKGYELIILNEGTSEEIQHAVFHEIAHAWLDKTKGDRTEEAAEQLAQEWLANR